MDDDARDREKQPSEPKDDLVPLSESGEPLAEPSARGKLHAESLAEAAAEQPADSKPEPFGESEAEPPGEPSVEPLIEVRRPDEFRAEAAPETFAPSTRVPLSAAIKAGRFGWAAFLASCTISGLVTFWPSVSISMVSDPEQTLWLYVVNNDGLLPVRDVIGHCAIKSISAGRQGGAGTIKHIEAFSPQHRRLIRPQDAHTFRCPSFVFDNPSLDVNGTVEIDVAYRYARFIRRAERACYQLEPRDNEGRMWVRQACP